MASEKKFLKIDGAPKVHELRAMMRPGSNEPLNPKTFRVGDPFHDRLVRDYDALDRAHVEASVSFYNDTMDNYDLYLAESKDERSKDELWRANIFVPLPGSNIETKVASECHIVTRADPIIQIEGVTEEDKETAGDEELLLDATYRMNSFRKFFMKHRRAVAIQGTDFIKPIWSERAHNVMVFTSKAEKRDFQARVGEAIQNGAPTNPDPGEDPQGFEEWRKLCNLTKKTSRPIPEYPMDGPRQIITFRGPEFTRLSLYDVHLDPLRDEIKDQERVFFRSLVSLDWVLSLTGDEPNKPFRPEQVEAAMQGWDGEDNERYEREISNKMGFNPMERQFQDPFWWHAVELMEVYDLDPNSEVKFSILMNRKAIINKDCFEYPTWSGTCLINAVRNIQVPGQLHGLSEYKWPKSLYKELNKFRNLRQDEATLRVMGVWTKLKEVGIPELMYKISPGVIMEVSRHDALQQMNKAALPSEAYREPAEIKAEIADAHGIWDSTKGAPATVGRVTGTEFAGRSENAQLRVLMGLACYEEEWNTVNQQSMALWAQNGREVIKMRYGGKLLEIPREKIIETISMQFRFRGVTQAIDRNLQAQQLMMVAEKFGQIMTPQAAFKLLGLILETLNIRGLESIITPQDVEAKTAEYNAAKQAEGAQAGAAGDAAAAARVDTSGVAAGPTAPAQPAPGAEGAPPGNGAPPAPSAPPAPTPPGA